MDSLKIKNQNTANNSDSLVMRFFASMSGLSTKVKSSVSDSEIFKVKNFEHYQTNLSLGYEYGLLRGYIDPDAVNPLQVFNVRGDFSVGLKSLPLLVSFNYSTWQNPLGVNNYFRIAFDPSRRNFSEHDLYRNGKEHFKNELSEVKGQRTDLLKRMNLGEVLMQKFKRELEQQKKELVNIEEDLRNTEFDLLEYDSLGQKPLSKRDSLIIKKNETQQKIDHAIVMYDSIRTVYVAAQEVLNGINQSHDNILNAQQEFQEKHGDYNNPAASVIKSKGFGVEHIRNLELGLSYPKLSGLSTGGVPIQGVNIEILKNDWYYSVCAGIMQNNLMMTTDATYNKFFNTQNLMNQFDFRNIQDRGLISQIKFGYGAPEKTHAHISISHLSNARASLFTNQQEQLKPSVGVELDFRLIPDLSPNTTLDLVYGKSSRYETSNSTTEALRTLFSDERTHAAKFGVKQRFKKIKTDVMSSVRWIDPFADTRSYGVVQPNHVRMEGRTIHHVTRNFRFGLNYRQDLGNIVFRSDSSSVLQVAGAFVDASLGKKITVFGSANYVDFKTRIQTQSQVNYMLNGGAAISYDLFDTKHNLIINIGDNLITDTSSTGLFRTVNIQKTSKLRRGSNTITLAYFEIDDPSLLQTSSIVFGNEFSWSFKKFKATAGAKGAMNQERNLDWGGKVELHITVTKSVNFQVIAERYILGDFFNNYNRNLYDTFPYAVMARMNFVIK